MAEKWYRLPIANSVVRVSSIEYITPIVTYASIGGANNYGFRVVYNNYTAIPLRVGPAGPELNAQSSNGAPVQVVLPSTPLENGYNATIHSANVAQLESIRNDLINVLTDNGVNLIDNFPGE